MSVNGVNGAGYPYSTQGVQNTQSAAEEMLEAVKQDTTAAKTDEFVKSTTQYKPDMDKVRSMKANMARNTDAFTTMVQGLVQNQGKKAGQALSMKDFFANLQVDEATRLDAQRAISEDGEWGVEAVATRLLDFAKALSGGDPAKAEELRKAVEDGFKAAGAAWGGEMPSITKDTYNRTMEMFDDWANEGKTAATDAVEE